MEQDTITPLELAQIDEDIKRAELLKTLKKSKAFKSLILDYFIDEGTETLMLNMSLKTDENFRDSMTEQLLARSYLKRFMMMIEQQGIEAEEYFREMNSEEV